MAAELSYIHRFEPGADPTLPPVLLLHGTGGDETGLLPLGREIAPGAALLSPRGNVLEGNMPRFFRRFHEGLFDEDDVRRRAGELANFVTEARRAYGLARPLAPIALWAWVSPARERLTRSVWENAHRGCARP
jgi:phospholipase/carboxylesterase